MSIIKIYHAYPPNFDCQDVPMSNYKEIAEVDCMQDIAKEVDVNILLDYAYNRSQNISKNWFENEGIKPLNGNKYSRSTTTGDILEFNGVKYRCEWIGWKRL